MDYLLIAAGLAALFLGGEMLVRGAIGMAHRLTIPPLLIGLTVVGFGTSMPELLVSLDATLRGLPDIAVGNVVGSNIANILLILGISALIWPVRLSDVALKRDIIVMVAAALALVPFFMAGQLGRGAGVLLVTALAGYLFLAYRQSAGQPGDEAAEEERLAAPPLWRALAMAAIGLVVLIAGARFLVDGSVALARAFGLSEAFIGLTIVAVGTSLPELATSMVAALRRQSDIAIGNVVGSNIFNVLGILGLTAVVAPVPIGERFLVFDLPVMIAVSLLAAALLLTLPRIGRVASLILLVAYVAYVWAGQG